MCFFLRSVLQLTEGLNAKVDGLPPIKAAVSGAGSHFRHTDWLLKESIVFKSAEKNWRDMLQYYRIIQVGKDLWKSLVQPHPHSSHPQEVSLPMALPSESPRVKVSHAFFWCLNMLTVQMTFPSSPKLPLEASNPTWLCCLHSPLTKVDSDLHSSRESPQPTASTQEKSSPRMRLLFVSACRETPEDLHEMFSFQTTKVQLNQSFCSAFPPPSLETSNP